MDCGWKNGTIPELALQLSEGNDKLCLMYKLDIIVPATGKREALLNYFATNGVTYLYSVEEFVHTFEADPETATDNLLNATAFALAVELSAEEGMGVYDQAESIDTMDAEDGTRLGWVVNFRQYDFYPEEFELDGFLV
jgi:hypothetical protein